MGDSGLIVLDIIVTSIEGVYKAELRRRCINVRYEINGAYLRRAEIDKKIGEKRHEILRALLVVIQQYMRQPTATCPNPIPQFEEHFAALCGLLRAYAGVARKPAGWAEDRIRQWHTSLSNPEAEEDELEHPLIAVLHRPAEGIVANQFQTICATKVT